MEPNLPAVEGPLERQVRQHTPGPWAVAARSNYRIEADAIPATYPHQFPSDDLGRMVALVGNRQPDFGAADAALIAASPDLLHALRDLVDVMTGHMDGETVALHNALAALRKADGAA